ncbi:PLP-dependent aminotransferase family protein [Actinoplanes sp. NPDC051861]|uniref:aminotransferase-like domain-containing protein n=1 Tax=Actinoplanes sp. NPDC051861 TaxID=3155170 RepID=UPI00342A533B
MTARLEPGDLHASLADPALTSMNLLNEVAGTYPDAISFAAGRPTEQFFDVDDVLTFVDAYRRHLEAECGYSSAEVNRVVLQYGRTKGVIHDLVAAHLAKDENIDADTESIVVTVGAQEAMFLVLRALRAEPRDVLLAVSPTYVGITGAARLLDMPVLPVREGPDGIDLDDLVARIRAARAGGLRPRACYLIPDFANPSGMSLDASLRRRLLDIAEREDILLLEDNPYGLFHGDAAREPTLKSLDTQRRVVYLGTFAKSVFPGVRVGYAVADQLVGDGLLADQLSKIKSMLTVNTSPIAQAVVAGKLLSGDGGLAAATAPERAVYAAGLRRIGAGLAARFGDGPVTWNTPAGGFFTVVTVPFVVDDALLEHSAREFGVIWTPMHHFYGGSGGHRQLRLASSAVGPEQIEDGLDRLRDLVFSRLSHS